MKSHLLGFIFFFITPPPMEGQGAFPPEYNDSIKQKTKYNFRYGFEKPYPVLSDTASRKTFKIKKGAISGNAGLSGGRLIYFDTLTSAYKTRFRYSVTGMFNIRLYKELSLSATCFYHINTTGQPPLPVWVSDMYYSVKWANWRPYTFSLGYENYADNRYHDNIGKWGEKALQGYLFVSFNAELGKKWVDKIRLDKTTGIVWVPMIRYFPTYRDSAYVISNNKLVLSLSMRYTIWSRLYMEAGAHYYTDPKTKMPWDPDFTYGFGYFDYRPWRISVTYGNWIANRFNFKPLIPGYGFMDGNFNIIYNYQF